MFLYEANIVNMNNKNFKAISDQTESTYLIFVSWPAPTPFNKGMLSGADRFMYIIRSIIGALLCTADTSKFIMIACMYSQIKNCISNELRKKNSFFVACFLYL